MGARLGLPIVVHVADPIAFFDPLDERNERWEELAGASRLALLAATRSDPADPEAGFTPFDEILAAFDRVIGRHPETTFIGAHVGCAAEDLALVRSMLERHPNYHVDISARIGELGRQPYTARRFFLDFADRILFGTDLGYDPAMYRAPLPLPGDLGRVLRLLDRRGAAAGSLADPWPRPARRRAAQGLRGERPTPHPRALSGQPSPAAELGGGAGSAAM